jgi:hypothetical protein
MGILTPVHASETKIPVIGKRGKVLVQTFLIRKDRININSERERGGKCAAESRAMVQVLL